MSDFAPSDPAFQARIQASFAKQGLMTSLGASLVHVAPVKRREFITLFGGATVVLPLAARAQQAGKLVVKQEAEEEWRKR